MKPKIAVHKFTSCDGCQLAFLNLGNDLLKLTDAVDIVHFAELGMVNPNAKVDIAFIEGSISTPHDLERIKYIRANATFLITIGACATAGGIQALRNFANAEEWVASIYPHPATISYLATSTPISDHVVVDLELWGCPVSGEQILTAIKTLLLQVKPAVKRDSVCLECKRNGNICVMVTKNIPCMGPVTQTGCGALCPSIGRDCYGCYGPAENPNTDSLTKQFLYQGQTSTAIQRRFLFINNHAPAFLKAGKKE
ncbi:MAG: sulfhydrogenase subunit delta [Gammaproteobacteria bacterium]